MKKTSLILALVFSFNVFAETEAKKNPQPSEAEIVENQACFQQLEIQGCRTQEEDPEQFRSCLANSHASMDDHCKALMLNLYGTK